MHVISIDSRTGTSYWHKILTRGDVLHRIRISEFELMEWYGKRAHVRQSGLSWGLVEEAMLDLLKDKPYMRASAPRPATEDPEQDSDDSDSDSEGEDDDRKDMEHLNQNMPDVWPHNPDTIVLPVETRPIEELRAGARRTSTRERKRPASFIEESYKDGETVMGRERRARSRHPYDRATQCTHGDRRQ